MSREHTQHRHDTTEGLLGNVYRLSVASPRCVLAGAGRSRADRIFAERPDLVTEAVNLRRIAERSAGTMGVRAVYLRHAWPVTEQDLRMLDACGRLVAQHCLARNPRLVDLDFVTDAVRDWAARDMRAGYEAHAQRLGYSRQHLEFRMAKGPRKQASPSVRYLCDALYLPAVARFEEALERRGIEWH